MSNEAELYRRYRPKAFKGVIGQEEAVAALQSMLKRNEVPHVLLMIGPSGSGKTTLARIMQAKLECSDLDFQEINAAKTRGIDMVRQLDDAINILPMGGKSRVWLLDEVHQLSADAQSALLKILEDPPDHAYFILATNEPDKLKKTVLTRCTKITCRALDADELAKLIKDVAAKEKRKLDTEVVEAIVEASEGSARQALVILHKVLGQSSTEMQLQQIDKVDVKKQGFDLAKALFNGANWKEIAGILKAIKDTDNDSSYEKVRQIVLSYATTITLNGGKVGKARMMYHCFEYNFFDNKFSGLVAAAFNCVHAK